MERIYLSEELASVGDLLAALNRAVQDGVINLDTRLYWNADGVMFSGAPPVVVESTPDGEQVLTIG